MTKYNRYVFTNLFIFITLFSCFTGCDNNERKLKRFIQEWQGRKIVIPGDSKIKVQGRDTDMLQINNSRFKILNYIDTSGCTACQMKLYEWTKLQKETDSLNLKVTYLFIVCTNKYEELETLQNMNHCLIPFIYDDQRKITKLNNFPSIPGLQTFLLDSMNQVLLIGNPIENEKIKALYIKRIQN